MKRLCIPRALSYDRESTDVCNSITSDQDERTAESLHDHPNESIDVFKPAPVLGEHSELVGQSSVGDPEELFDLAKETSSSMELVQCYLECGECYNNDANMFRETFQKNNRRGCVGTGERDGGSGTATPGVRFRTR